MGSSCSERLAGTYLVPHPWLTMPCWPTVERIARFGLTALAAPPDFLALDKVATVVQERYAQVLWIRLQSADADPGALLVTLLGAAARLDGEASQGIAEDVARHARHGEWQHGYQLLADWLVAATVPPALLEGLDGAAVMIESIGCRSGRVVGGWQMAGVRRPGGPGWRGCRRRLGRRGRRREAGRVLAGWGR